jgi:hypothetical protein
MPWNLNYLKRLGSGIVGASNHRAHRKGSRDVELELLNALR